VLEALDWPKIVLLKAMEPATAVDAWMNSRRVLLSSIVTSVGNEFVIMLCAEVFHAWFVNCKSPQGMVVL
jgi:hypothetical protein